MTIVLKKTSNIIRFRKDNYNKKIAFVPTMGNLHDGHLSLMEIAKEKADITIASIFVNPTQFGENEDLNSYPRTFDKDLEKLKSIGVDIIFYPSILDIYPFGIDDTISIHLPKNITNILCGISRPDHFQGVATVVTKLLQIIKANILVLGEKDFQQVAVIRRLVNELFIDVDIYGGEIIREKSGLAMSSRNQYLTKKELQDASRIFDTLCYCRKEIYSGENIVKTINKGKEKLNNVGVKVEYLDFRDIETLSLSPTIEKGILLVAARLGKTRLIDNLRMVTI